MGYTLKLQLDIRFKKDTPDHVIDFLMNGHLYDEQIEFAYFHGEDCKEEHNIFNVKHQYQFTQNGVDEYRYELFARIFVRDDDQTLIFRFCTYMAQYTENEGYVGYYQNIDNPKSEPELLYFIKENVTIKDITNGHTFTTNWTKMNDPNL
jgi:hypothetical protein